MAVGPPVLGYMFSPSQVTLRKTCSGGLVVWQEIADLAGISIKILQCRLVVELAVTLNKDEIDKVI